MEPPDDDLYIIEIEDRDYYDESATTVDVLVCKLTEDQLRFINSKITWRSNVLRMTLLKDMQVVSYEELLFLVK